MQKGQVKLKEVAKARRSNGNWKGKKREAIPRKSSGARGEKESKVGASASSEK